MELGVVAVWAAVVMSWMFWTFLAELYGGVMAVSLTAVALPPWFASFSPAG
jgi:hypothetical protein